MSPFLFTGLSIYRARGIHTRRLARARLLRVSAREHRLRSLTPKGSNRLSQLSCIDWRPCERGCSPSGMLFRDSTRERSRFGYREKWSSPTISVRKLFQEHLGFRLDGRMLLADSIGSLFLLFYWQFHGLQIPVIGMMNFTGYCEFSF